MSSLEPILGEPLSLTSPPLPLHGVSVVICCYNSSDRLTPTLEALGDVDQAHLFAWEILLIDNGSTDGAVKPAAQNCPPHLRPRIRICSEAQPGLSSARLRGIREARYDIISFIDDDNWVCRDWISRVVAIFDNHPAVGVVGGPSIPVFEQAPPRWFNRISGFYAIGPQHRLSGDITETPGTLLWGAGLSLRRNALLELLQRGFQFSLTDRTGGNLSTGGDTELCLSLRASGWRFWYDDQLTLRHFIPAMRIQWSYARTLMQGMGRASVIINVYLIAFGRHPFERAPEYSQTWPFQFARVLKEFLKILVAHPFKSLRCSDGCQECLTFETRRAALCQIWELRAKYSNLISRIRSARWNTGQNRDRS